ncbi:MAG TPA: VWA domain-containing protein, partial [Thermoanaerobaculia bacterium]|nr:VWA domain-containing protein [Thermoanaerobaculia bacterium]
MNKPPRWAVVLLALLVTGSAFAQSETPSAQYAEEIEVRVIDVDVVVTDRKGNRLTNLTRGDFELYEAGKRVDIAYFSRTAGGRVADVPLPGVQTAPAGTEVVAIAPQAAPRIPLTWIIFIDQTNLMPQSRNRSMRALQSFVQNAISRGDRGVIALNNGRSFKIRHGVTADPKLLMETLAKIEKERVPVSPTRSRTNSLLNQMRRGEADFGAGQPFQMDHELFMATTAGDEIQAIINEEAARTRSAIAAMSALLDSLATVDGRLALVYVGAGFNTLPAADLAATWRARYGPRFQGISSEPRPEEQTEPIEREITRLYNNLSALRVTVYSIHGGEQGGGPTSPEDSGSTDTMMTMSTDIGQL